MKANLGLFTDTHETIDSFSPIQNSTYLYSSKGGEERSQLDKAWVQKNATVHYFNLEKKYPPLMSCRIQKLVQNRYPLGISVNL